MFIGGSVLSGLYPAFVLSGFKPVSVLKGLFKNSAGGYLLRKGLIIMQFATSVVLIAGTIIVFQQVNYMRKQSLGVNINQTLVLDGAQICSRFTVSKCLSAIQNRIASDSRRTKCFFIYERDGKRDLLDKWK